jgi:hypothetical protein
MQTGTNNGYDWLEADPELRTFLSLCPEAIVGKYLAITAVDSGSFVPSEADATEGWKNVGGIAYSPCLGAAPDLPKRCCCLDFMVSTNGTFSKLLRHWETFAERIFSPQQVLPKTFSLSSIPIFVCIHPMR